MRTAWLAFAIGYLIAFLAVASYSFAQLQSYVA